MMLVLGSTIFQIHIQNHFSPENCFLQIPLNCSFSKVQATFEAQLCHFFFFQLDRMLLEGSQKLLNLEERKFFQRNPKFFFKKSNEFFTRIFFPKEANASQSANFKLWSYFHSWKNFLKYLNVTCYTKYLFPMISNFYDISLFKKVDID